MKKTLFCFIAATLLVVLLFSSALGFQTDKDDNEIPGLLSGIGRGFDVVSGDVKAPIVKFHYDLGHKWTNPYTGNTYNVPDELAIANTPSASMDRTSDIVRNVSEYTSLQEKWHHISIGIPGFIGFHDDKESGAVKHLLEGGNKTLYMSTRDFTFYEMEMWPYFLLEDQDNTHFAHMLDALPADRNTDEAKTQYDQFIQAFGTHYMQQTKFGGHLSYFCAVNNTIYSKYSSDWVYHQVSLEVQLSDWHFGIGEGKNTSEIIIAKEFEANTDTEILRKGGKVESGHRYSKEWFKSTLKNPTYITPVLHPIDTLLPDNVDPAKRKALKEAVDEYIKASTKDNRKSIQINADSPPPVLGLNEGIARGYDVVSEMIKAPVTDFHYDYGQTWRNPYRGDQIESYPDELYLTNIANNVVNGEIINVNKWSQYLKEKTSSINVNIGLGIGSVSADAAFSRTKHEAESLLKNETHSFGTENHIISYYQLTMWPDFELHPHFKVMVDRLPSTYSSDADRQAYAQIVNFFGTHYIGSAQFGAKVNFTTTYDSLLTEKHSEKWVSEQLDLSVTWAKIKIGVDVGQNKTDKHVSHDFSEHSTNFNQHVGGNPAVYESQGYKQWVQTIADNPGMIEDCVVMYPIHSLISDKTKNNIMLKVLQNYVNTGKLQ